MPLIISFIWPLCQCSMQPQYWQRRWLNQQRSKECNLTIIDEVRRYVPRLLVDSVKHLIFYLSSCFIERTAKLTNIWVKSHRNIIESTKGQGMKPNNYRWSRKRCTSWACRQCEASDFIFEFMLHRKNCKASEYLSKISQEYRFYCSFGTNTFFTVKSHELMLHRETKPDPFLWTKT
jgi:hypothetical protein